MFRKTQETSGFVWKLFIYSLFFFIFLRHVRALTFLWLFEKIQIKEEGGREGKEEYSTYNVQ